MSGSGAVTLALDTDWRTPAEWMPAVCEYVVHAPCDAGHLLVLPPGDDVVPTSSVARMLERVCDWASGGADFADVAVDAAPVEAIRVADAADVASALGLSSSRDADGAAALLARARAAKEIERVVRLEIDSAHVAAARRMRPSESPLVSVPIPTWKGHEVLVERTIPSVLNGTYRNVEVIVVSDGPDDAARRAVEGFADPRVRYLEVPARPVYPTHSFHFWMVAGTDAANLALSQCRGEWVAPLDHDDSFTDDHIARLLAAARAADADMVYGQGICESRSSAWRVIGSTPLQCGAITHGSVLFRGPLAGVRFDPSAWLVGEPGDWNKWQRMARAGARIGFLERVVLVHYMERTAIEGRADIAGRDLEGDAATADTDVAEDVRSTEAAWLARLARRSAVPAAV